MRIHLAKFTRSHSILDQAAKPLVKRPKIFTHDPFELRSGVHHFPLDQPWIVWMRGKKIKIAVDPRDQAVTRAGLGRDLCERGTAKLSQEVFHYGTMQPALIAKVVVEHG